MVCINRETHLSEYHKKRLEHIKDWFIDRYDLPDLQLRYRRQISGAYRHEHIDIAIREDRLKCHPQYKYAKINLMADVICQLLHELIHHLQYCKYRKWLNRYYPSKYQEFVQNDYSKQEDYYKIRTEYFANKMANIIFEKYFLQDLTF